jgi:hypothetical protein
MSTGQACRSRTEGVERPTEFDDQGLDGLTPAIVQDQPNAVAPRSDRSEIELMAALPIGLLDGQDQHPDMEA